MEGQRGDFFGFDTEATGQRRCGGGGGGEVGRERAFWGGASWRGGRLVTTFVAASLANIHSWLRNPDCLPDPATTSQATLQIQIVAGETRAPARGDREAPPEL
jgi:hypothetical protein